MIEIARQEIADIPCLVLRETRVNAAPVVIHYHGWTGDKGSIERPDQSLVQSPVAARRARYATQFDCTAEAA